MFIAQVNKFFDLAMSLKSNYNINSDNLVN